MLSVSSNKINVFWMPVKSCTKTVSHFDLDIDIKRYCSWFRYIIKIVSQVIFSHIYIDFYICHIIFIKMISFKSYNNLW